MIEVNGLKKRYRNAFVLDGLDMAMPRQGLIGISGPSGSGKSTLLKILAGLLSFEGRIRAQDRDLGSLNAVGRLDWRLTEVGLLYQSYRLFENETAAWNAGLPLRMLGLSELLIKRHVADWLKEVGLYDCRDRRVSTLSGGEKQRLAAVRALIKQPRIILADEPTAALDTANKHAIFRLLCQMKEHRLVIVVSHEQDLLEQYADVIYRLEDGRIVDSYNPPRTAYAKKAVRQRLPVFARRGHLPWAFCFRHAIQDMKTHRWRHWFAQAMLTLALLGTGIGMNLATAIPKKMAATFDRMMGQSGIQITSRARPLGYLSTLHGAEEDSLDEILFRYRDYELDIGVAYRTDINGLFPDRNQIFMTMRGPIVPLPSFQARHLADAMTFAELGLPNIPLDNDEIFLAVPETDLKIIARQLRCEIDEAVINQKLESEEILLGAGFANLNWQYEDEQLWRLKGVFMSERAHVVHSNPRFNEFVFETSMRFPTTFDLEGPLEWPWVLRKVFFLSYRGSQNLLEKLSQDISLRRYRFDQINHEYVPTYCWRFGPCPLSRFLVLFDPRTTVTEAEIAYIQKMEPDLAPALIGTEGGYLIYPEAMMSGFAHETFLAGDLSALEQAIDWFSWTEPIRTTDRLPERTVRGYYQDQSDEVLRLRPSPASGYEGTLPTNTSQIAISTGLAEALFDWKPELGTIIHCATRFVVGEEKGTVRSEFVRAELTLTAVVADKGMYLYGSPLWSLRFFIEQMGIPASALRPLTVMFEGIPDRLEESAARIKRTFPDFDISFPQAELHRQINEITNKINSVVIAMAGFAGLNALGLALLVTNLSWLDMTKDRRLLLELGASSENAQQLMTARILILFGTALAISIIGVLSAGVLIEVMLSDYFATPIENAFPLLAVTSMALLALLLAATAALMNRFRRPER
ncbi:MAG: ATP-binding cassette domain-containing protein [Bacilli bacterium]|jgi:ABC-type lipoprotein export system ATPase subunit